MHSELFALTQSVSPEAFHVAQAVFQAGEAVKTITRHAKVAEGQGHRSLITEGDKSANRLMIEYLAAMIPEIKILSEESSDHPALLSKEDPRGILGKGIFSVIDPIDSTVRYSHDMAGWSVGGGLIRDGKIEVSAVYAPATNEGMFVFAASGHGVWCAEWNQAPRRITIDQAVSPKKGVVLIGVDPMLYRSIMSVVPDIGYNVQAIYSSGSGILGLATVASGKAQAVIQAPQKAWDWAAAYCAVVESGNVFKFFRIKGNGDIVSVKTHDYDAFCYEPSKRLGFVAGIPSLVEKNWETLPKTGWEQVNPDTVQSTW